MSLALEEHSHVIQPPMAVLYSDLQEIPNVRQPAITFRNVSLFFVLTDQTHHSRETRDRGYSTWKRRHHELISGEDAIEAVGYRATSHGSKPHQMEYACILPSSVNTNATGKSRISEPLFRNAKCNKCNHRKKNSPSSQTHKNPSN